MNARRSSLCRSREAGLALLAVLFALMLLMMLALPFAVSMSIGADAAMRDVDEVSTEQASASVRELLLAEVALSHTALDATPEHDGRSEFPAGVELPESLLPLTDGGRVLLGGEVVDLQRLLALDGASPLLLANAIGTATRLQEDLEPDARVMVVQDASALPDQGYLWLANEVVRYQEKQGNTLIGLDRGLFRGEGFADGTRGIRDGVLVLDYRCVLAAAWPHLRATEHGRRPYRAVAELLEVRDAGLGAFAQHELDTFERVFSAESMAERSAVWGRPERVFNELVGGESRMLMLRSALHVGAGSTVRLRNLRTGAVEYGVLMTVATQRRGRQQLRLPSVFELGLLQPVSQSFPAVDTVVEPLVPAPVNLNTASEEVLRVLMSRVRRGQDIRIPQDNGRRATLPPEITEREAQGLASEIVALRAGGDFTGWQDLVERVFRPRFAGEAGDSGNDERSKWLLLYRALRTGRDSQLEMGGSPICFTSGPWVRYRAAASRSRSVVAAGVVGRHERTGIAAVVPGFQLQRRWDGQDDFEAAFVLDRRSPYWVTAPVNLGHLLPNAAGNDPAGRYYPHLIPHAYPSFGFGAPRFSVADAVDAGIEPGVVMARPGRWTGMGAVPVGLESFAQSLDRRGHDVRRQGPYLMANTGPSELGATPPPNNSRRHDQIRFPFSVDGGFLGRTAVSFWAEPQSLSGQILYEYGDGDPDRNAMRLAAQDGNLVFEILDEAGLDPNWAASPAGVPRTSSRIELPLAELALPANTPVHVSASAPSGRPGDLALFVDGVARGKRPFVTYLTAALPAFDPQLANNNAAYGQDPNQIGGNDRYLELQVESTEGFPKVGVLRIGLELFEYTAINGNAFVCRFRDSMGGRGARQRGREHRPALPVDPNTGEPLVDIDDPQFQDVNLDVFPEHPAGAMVELYGFSALVSEDFPLQPGQTQLSGAIGGFSVARAWVKNPDPIAITPLQGPPLPIGVGIDESYSGDIELADPVPTGNDQPPNAASDEVAAGFAATGGYALLIQERRGFESNSNQPGQPTSTTEVGGIELIRYGARNGTTLSQVQRAQTVNGNNQHIASSLFDGTARRFVTDYDNGWLVQNPGQGGGNLTWDDLPTLITWVVPISLPVQNTSALWDPELLGFSEWLQLLPQGGNAEDLEWVRYDQIAPGGGHVLRSNRAAWARVYHELTRSRSRQLTRVGPLGPDQPPSPIEPPWGTVTASTGFIGYTPQLESLYPQIHWARRRLGFRGDPFTQTSSHAHQNAQVTQCHRMQLRWGNYGAYTGRLGRHDRVALAQGAESGGSQRNVEWHSVTWTAYRWNSERLRPGQLPVERLGEDPFQLIAFTEAVAGDFLGPKNGTVVQDPRRYDRVMKFPSGELPGAFCPSPTVGAGVDGRLPMQGVVDEVEVYVHPTADLVLEESCDATAQQLVTNPNFTNNAVGVRWSRSDLSAGYPRSGGLIQVDDEVMAYTAVGNGQFELAPNGRGLLNTEARGHDRGARIKFLTQRPAAILNAGLSGSESVLRVQDGGVMPPAGTVRVGNELMHYTWIRTAQGDSGGATLEMPDWFPPREDGGFDPDARGRGRGLFRGRYGTAPQGASSGDVAILWPTRHWDRYADFSDDPELSYFQLTTNEAPVFFRGISYRVESKDPRVRVVCRVRTDSRVPWSADPEQVDGLFEFVGAPEDGVRHRIGRQSSRLEVRFQVRYEPGAIDLQAFTQHGWKQSVRVEDVRVDYEGASRIFDEQVTAR